MEVSIDPRRATCWSVLAATRRKEMARFTTTQDGRFDAASRTQLRIEILHLEQIVRELEFRRNGALPSWDDGIYTLSSEQLCLDMGLPQLSMSCWAKLASKRLSELDNPTVSKGSAYVDQIGLELRHIAQIIRDLSIRHNASLPDHRVPVEIMGMIFSLVADEDVPFPKVQRGRFTYDSIPGNVGWMKVTHVCRRWRMLALNQPALWASSVTTLPKAFPEILGRAGSCLFTLNISHTFFVHHIASLADRTKAISSDQPHLHDVVNALSKVAFPVLETVHLPQTNAPRILYAASQPSISLPRLRHAVLSDVFFKMTCPNLVSLTLSRLSLPMSTAGLEDELARGSAFLDLLEASSSLKQLIIGCWLPDLSQLPPRVVSLRQLASIRVFDFTHHCLELWKRLRLPTAVKFHLSLLMAVSRYKFPGSVTSGPLKVENGTTQNIFRTVGPHIQAVDKASSYHRVTVLDSDFDKSAVASTAIHFFLQEELHPRDDDLAREVAILGYARSDSSFPTILRCLLSDIAFTHLKCLTISSVRDLDVEGWQRLLQMECLKGVSIRCSAEKNPSLHSYLVEENGRSGSNVAARTAI